MDEIAVHRMIGQYCNLIDDARIDELSQLFAEGAIFDVSSFGIRKEGRTAIREQFRQMADPNVKGTHCTFNPIIYCSAGEATAVCDFIWVSLVARPYIGLAGRYHLRFVVSDTRWLISEMRVEVRSNPAYIAAG